jgi:calpain-15
MRNPWKEGEWTGKFSDNSDEWTPALRAELNHYPSNDGIFWMTFQDMV